MVEGRKEKRQLERNEFNACPFCSVSKSFGRLGNLFVVVMAECVSPFVVYSVICHGCVGWMKQLLLVQDDWREP